MSEMLDRVSMIYVCLQNRDPGCGWSQFLKNTASKGLMKGVNHLQISCWGKSALKEGVSLSTEVLKNLNGFKDSRLKLGTLKWMCHWESFVWCSVKHDCRLGFSTIGLFSVIFTSANFIVDKSQESRLSKSMCSVKNTYNRWPQRLICLLFFSQVH